jgi:hypothetical protein
MGGGNSLNDDIKTPSAGPLADLQQIRQAPLREVLAGLHRALHHPMTYGDTDGVEAVAQHLIKVVFGNPAVPVTLEHLVRLRLAQLLHAIPFGAQAATSHYRKCGQRLHQFKEICRVWWEHQGRLGDWTFYVVMLGWAKSAVPEEAQQLHLIEPETTHC